MAQLSSGDLVRISYTGRLASDKSLFETTDEQSAREGGIWSTASTYGPRLVVVGKSAMLKGLEESIQTLKPGQNGLFKIPADKAFGPRFPELVRMVSLSEFQKNGVQPQPGLVVMVDRVPATVKSVSAGRVMLDFNHPFAGQDVEYSVQLLEVFTDPAEKARALGSLFGIPVRVEKSGAKNRIVVSEGKDAQKAKGLANALKASLGDWAEISIEKQK